MGAGTAGAVFDAIARMKRDMPKFGRQRSSVRPHELGVGPKKEPFDCMFLCDACGYLCDTDPPCPSCGRSEWIDLDYWGLAEALRAREEEERKNPSPQVKWQVRLASLATGSAVGVGCAAGLALAGVVALGWPALLGFGAGATALTHGLGRRRIGWSLMARRVQRPTRWRLPLPLPAADAQVAERVVGHPEPRGPLLRAPFSGRPCLGYELGVLFDAPNDAWPPIWVLREMRSCAFEVAGRVVDADAVSLALPIAPITAPAMTEAEHQRFLRERGLFLADGAFDLFEAIIEPGRTHDLLWPTAPAAAPPVIRATRDTPRRAPYR